MSDRYTLKGYHEGGTSILAPANRGPWATPLLWWGSFVLVLVFVMQCINAIMRRQWTDNEKLRYPLITLPMEMTRGGDGASLYRSRLFWLGSAAGAALDIYNGIAFLYPALPQINVKVKDISTHVVSHPWRAIGWTTVSYYPFIVALSFFLPQDVAFSCWSFYLFRKAIQVFAAATGWGGMAGAPFLVEQAWGGWMAFAGLAAWSARRHIRQVWHTIWDMPGGMDDEGEPMRYRWAVTGLALGLAYLIMFWARAGASAGPMLLYFVLYYALFAAVTKMRAEIGPPTHELGSMATTHMLVKALGSQNMTRRTLVGYAFLWFNNRMVRSHQMPIQLQGLKMAERSGINYRRLMWAMMLAILAGLLSEYWALLSDAYASKGARGTGFAGEAFRHLQAWLGNRQGPQFVRVAFMGAGAGFALLLGAARMRFVGWPFHPAGYALGMVFRLDCVWMPILMAWLFKGLLLRYGSLRTHGAAIMLACGVILGEFVVGSFWSSLSVILDKPM